MKIKELYAKKIDRDFEAVVDINKKDEKVVDAEINEYVFTEEIISGLYQILSGIQYHKVTHNGTWINGYYGSGKSHFLKYLKYCFSKEHQAEALKRLEQAVRDINIEELNDVDSFPSPNEIVDTNNWLKKTEIENIAFNFGDEDNKNEEENKSFVHVFWRMFHKFRGYNRESLVFGHYLERLLDEAGQLDAFNERLSELNLTTRGSAYTAYLNDTDTVLDVAKQLVPTLNVEAIRNRINNNDLDASVYNFCDTLRIFLETKGDNYRLLFFFFFSSQYIDGRKYVLLQLQQLAATLETVCGDEVWIICTAQQSLAEVIGDCHIDKKSDEFGNIIDRFPVRVPLEDVDATYITQKRFLVKNGKGAIDLGDLYDKKRTEIEGLFSLPIGLSAFDSKESFEIYYPFVPYQFELIKRVLRAFRNLEYVETTVKDSERSILRIVYNAANKTKDYELGDFIPFDQFLPSIGVLAHNGKVAISTPNDVAKRYNDFDFAKRVVNVLFMLCHMNENDKNLLPASVDNISTLLISKIGEDIRALRERVLAVINFFIDSNILKKERLEGANYDIYSFYTEEESEVATKIKNTQSGGDTAVAEMWKPVINRYLGCETGRKTFGSTNVNVGLSIFDLYAQGGNYDLLVNMKFYSDSDDPDAVAMTNSKKNLIFLLSPLWKNDKELQKDINWCCRCNNYLKEPVTSQVLAKINDSFRLKAQEIKRGVVTKMENYLDRCEIISGNDVITSRFTGSKGAQRFKNAIEAHFHNVYSYANYVDGLPTSADALKEKMLRPIQPGEYEGVPATEAEKDVQRYLDTVGDHYNLADLVNHYKVAPYGWLEESTIYVENELVRQLKRAYVYMSGNVRITPQRQAEIILRSKADFEIVSASAIPVTLVNDFIQAWRDIFNIHDVPGGSDSTQLYLSNKENNDSYLNKAIDSYSRTLNSVSQYPFSAPYQRALDLFKDWQRIDGEKEFFENVISRKDEAKKVMDECKAVQDFVNKQLTKYEDIIDFIKDNEANFQHLGEEEQKVLVQLQQLTDDETPYAQGKFPTYIKLYKEINKKIADAVERAKETIRRNYKSAYDQLLTIVKSKGLPETVLSDLDAKISIATASNDIATLIMRSDTTNFFNDQIARINNFKRPDSTSENETDETGGAEAGDQPSSRPIKTIRLIKPEKQILSTKDDVEAYLQLLRKQLMSHIDKGEDIVI